MADFFDRERKIRVKKIEKIEEEDFELTKIDVNVEKLK